MLFAVRPVTQPPHSNPMMSVSTTTSTQDQNIAVLVGRASIQRSPRLRFRGVVSMTFPPDSTIGGQDENAVRAR